MDKTYQASSCTGDAGIQLGMGELHQVRIGPANAQKEHGLACDVGDGDRRAAFGVGIRLGENGAVDGHRLVEEARRLHYIKDHSCRVAARFVLDDLEAVADSCLKGAGSKKFDGFRRLKFATPKDISIFTKLISFTDVRS